VLFAKPLAASLFLMLNGVILAGGEWYRRRHGSGAVEGEGAAVGPAGRSRVRRWRDERIVPMDEESERALARVGPASAGIIGVSQVLALLAGISREGVTMVGGLLRGLDNENAMRFSFLLSTPVILAAGALKVPDLLGTLGNGVRAQVVAGSVAAAASSLFAILFLSRYYKSRTLVPFAVYCLVFGLVSALRFGVF